MQKTAAAVVLALGLLMSVSPAGAFTSGDKPANRDDKSTVIQGAGSATTFSLMLALGRAYQESPGCSQYSYSFPNENPGNPGKNYFGQNTQNTNTCLDITLQQDPATVLEENYDHDVVANYYPAGSTGGQRLLCAQGTAIDPNHAGTGPRQLSVTRYIDWARSSSGWVSQASKNPCTRDYFTVGEPVPDLNLTLRFVGFAKDALTWVAWPSKNYPGGIQNLTQAQLVDIYVDCDINDWGDLVPALDPTWNGSTYTNTPPGGPGSIEVWTVLRQSGTREDWEKFLGASATDFRSENCIPSQYKNGDFTDGERIIIEHNASDIVGAGNEENAIYFFSAGIHGKFPDRAAGSVVGNINGIAPTEANVVAGAFPTARTVYNVTRQAGPSPLKTGPTLAFVGPNGWICNKPSFHAKPNGTPGLGVDRGNAITNGGELVKDTLEAEGFYLLTQADASRCTFADYNLWPTTTNKPGRANGGNGNLTNA